MQAETTDWETNNSNDDEDANNISTRRHHNNKNNQPQIDNVPCKGRDKKMVTRASKKKATASKKQATANKKQQKKLERKQKQQAAMIPRMTIGISGPASCGKSTVAGLLQFIFRGDKNDEDFEICIADVTLLHQDDYLKPVEECITHHYFDPSARDMAL